VFLARVRIALEKEEVRTEIRKVVREEAIEDHVHRGAVGPDADRVEASGERPRIEQRIDGQDQITCADRQQKHATTGCPCQPPGDREGSGQQQDLEPRRRVGEDGQREEHTREAELAPSRLPRGQAPECGRQERDHRDGFEAHPALDDQPRREPVRARVPSMIIREPVIRHAAAVRNPTVARPKSAAGNRSTATDSGRKRTSAATV